MAKVLLVVVVVVLIALLVAGVGFILKKPQEKLEGGLKIITPATEETSETAKTGENKEVKTEEAKTYNINIENFAYSPSELKIKKGDKVIWTNKDSSRHTITSDTGKELDSELLDKEGAYSHTFNTAGTFSYHCKPHPYMKAKIIVE